MLLTFQCVFPTCDVRVWISCRRYFVPWYVAKNRMAPSDTMDTPGRPYQPHKFNDCPICLEGFSHGFGVVGADGLPAAVMHCGHAFCQR